MTNKKKLTKKERQFQKALAASQPKAKKLPKTALGRFLTSHKSNRSVGGSIALLLFLFLFALVSLFPVVFMVSNAFKPLNELFIFPPKLFVMQPTTANFSDLFELLSGSLVPFLRYLFNTLFIVLLGSIGHVILSSMAAFPLAKFKFPGVKLINRMILLALMFSAAVTAVPNFMILSNLRLIDTYWAVILPSLALSVGLFLMKNFMEQVPDALIDAAMIDGCNYFVMLWKIVMPAVKPAWITLFIISFQGLWGNTGGSFLYKENIKPLSAMLGQIAGGGVGRTGVVAAISLMMFVVPVVIFIISQSNVLETMTTSGIKE